MALFNYTGPDPSDPSSYSLTSTPTCTSPTEQMCSLEANDDGNGQPIITDALKNEMINSLQNQVNGLHVKLKAR